MNDNTPRGESFFQRFHGWRLSLTIDGESIAKAAIIAALLVFFSLLETTLFTTFHPFGVTPDLILPLVVAAAVFEREKWGAVFGVIAAFVIESLGGSTLTILPILYMPVGYVIGILSVHYFRDCFATRALYTAVTSLLRAVFTMITIFTTYGGVTLITALKVSVLPELLCNIVFAVLPHAAVSLCLGPFHKAREERSE